MNKTAVALFALTAALSASAQLSINPVPQSTDPNSWWQKRFAAKQELVKAGGSEVVFIGDSITDFWESRGKAQWEKYFAGEPFKALNLGYSADRTEHVLWRIDHGELDGYKAKCIVLMIGTNNSGHHPVSVETPIDTIEGISRILGRIRQKQPEARTLLCAIFPRGEGPNDPCRMRNEQVNAGIKQLCDGERVIWCDFNQRFLTADGILPKEIMPDRLHPNGQGYEIWAESIIPQIKKCLAAGPFEPRTLRAEGRVRDFLGRMAQKRSQICNNASKEFDVVFVGDSITHNWEGPGKKVFQERFKDYNILNLGYGGDRTQHVIWRLQNGELEGYKAKLFMLMIGTNNGDNPEHIAAGIRKILDIIAQKHPEAKILLLPIFPRGKDSGDHGRIKNEKVNAIIKGYADNDRVLWCDFNQKYLKDNGELPRELMPDLLHPNHDGYIIWADAVTPFFKEACGK
ncbi:MAG: hypothetical protein IJU44_04830 [Kiritimatiellae bacterium]|nr:hypothetical protein [Kiritimatiellia bacterium]